VVFKYPENHYLVDDILQVRDHEHFLWGDLIHIPSFNIKLLSPVMTNISILIFPYYVSQKAIKYFPSI
jgi:hypothetical protein